VRAHGGRWIVAVAAVVAIASAAPASAAAVTFGADLGAASQTAYTCPTAFNTNTCLVFSSAPGPTFYAPTSGTVTAVRVKIGGAGGQMQIVVMRSLYQNNGGDPGHPYFACCFVEEYGPTFNAATNAITTVPTSLPMVEDSTPPPNDTTTNARGDFLAISVLDPNVPIPVSQDGNSFYSAIYPAPTPGNPTAPSYNPILVGGQLGYHVMMNADLEVDGGGGGGAPKGGGVPGGGAFVPGPAPPPPPVPALNLPNLTISVNGNTATVPIQCFVVDCTGTLALQNAQLAGVARAARAGKKKKAKKPKVVSYGSVSFSLKAGTTGNIKIKLDGAGRRLLKSHKTAKVWANVRFSAGGGAPRSIRVTLKR
jgi:hypothetical protein